MPRPSRPSQLVDERNRLIDAWKPGGAYHRVAGVIAAVRGTAEAYTQFEYRTLSTAAMWWVSADMCDLIEQAMGTVPVDTLLERDLVSDIQAFVMFERPLVLTDAATGRRELNVDSVMWGPAHLSSEPWLPEFAKNVPADRPNSLGVSSYQWATATDRLVPLGRSDWLLGSALGDALQPTTFPERSAYTESSLEDRRLVAALWLLSSQKGVATIVDEQADRATTRRAERRGHLAAVRVVSLRQMPHAHDASGDGTGRTLSVRFLVGGLDGFWRSQPYGPGRAYRRPTWIAPYMKGPVDAPLLNRPTVKTLR